MRSRVILALPRSRTGPTAKLLEVFRRGRQPDAVVGIVDGVGDDINGPGRSRAADPSSPRKYLIWGRERAMSVGAIFGAARIRNSESRCPRVPRLGKWNSTVLHCIDTESEVARRLASRGNAPVYTNDPEASSRTRQVESSTVIDGSIRRRCHYERPGSTCPMSMAITGMQLVVDRQDFLTNNIKTSASGGSNEADQSEG